MWRRKVPATRRQLVGRGVADESTLDQLEATARAQVATAVDTARAIPAASTTAKFADVWPEPWEIR
jgi:TPP-dependent pyruvate/acetoin dehydrogenase alpha subunit